MHIEYSFVDLPSFYGNFIRKRSTVFDLFDIFYQIQVFLILLLIEINSMLFLLSIRSTRSFDFLFELFLSKFSFWRLFKVQLRLFLSLAVFHFLNPNKDEKDKRRKRKTEIRTKEERVRSSLIFWSFLVSWRKCRSNWLWWWVNN